MNAPGANELATRLADPVDTVLDALRALDAAPDDQWRSLPPAAYDSPALFALEAEHLYRRGWVLIGRADQVRAAGDYLAFDVLDEPLVMTRDHHDVLHVLSRVCRHRWMDVCRGRGNARVLVCPYHAWTYELDGRLRGAPEMRDAPGFDPAAVRLPAIRFEVWRGFVFVNLSGDAAPLADALAEADRHLAGYALEEWVTVRGLDLGEAPWDWKVFMDNGEIYHHLMLHKEIVEPRSPAHLSLTGCRADECFVLHGPAAPSALVRASDGKPTMPSYLPPVGDWAPSRLTALQRTAASYFYPYPNYVIALWVNVGIFFRVNPLGPGRCHIHVDYMVPGEFADHPALDAAIDQAVESFGVVHGQDAMACEAVQRGLRSRHAAAAVLGPLEEHNHAFARWYARRMRQAVDGSP